jgi:acyl carrier protein
VKIETEIRQYLAETFLPGTPAESIDAQMPLVTGGIIDSLGMLHLIDFIESRYSIEFLPREIDMQALDTLDSIVSLVDKKIASTRPSS